MVCNFISASIDLTNHMAVFKLETAVKGLARQRFFFARLFSRCRFNFASSFSSSCFETVSTLRKARSSLSAGVLPCT